MKNKSAVLFVLGMLGFLAVASNAAPGVRGSKGMTLMTGAVTTVGISTGPAVLYSVVLGTGAVTDFVAIFDSATPTGLSAILQTQASGYKGRIYPSSATQNTNVVFDPPLQFNKGIVAIQSTALVPALFVWESGRSPNGQ